MFQIKVTPDNGKRYTVTVERGELAVTVGEVARRVALGEVQSFTVHTIYKNDWGN